MLLFMKKERNKANKSFKPPAVKLRLLPQQRTVSLQVNLYILTVYRVVINFGTVTTTFNDAVELKT